MKILGTGSALPEKIVRNDDLALFLDTSDEWISTRTGIRERRVLSEETLLDLANRAAENALENAKVAADDLDMILVTTAKGEAVTPATACMVQGAIGAHCPAFDLNAACAGFLYALDTADAFIASKKAKTILVVSAEALSRFCDWKDRSTCVLFGDGAGAVVVGEGDGLIGTKLFAQSNEPILYAYGDPGNSPYEREKHPLTPLHMAGQEVYKFAVSHSSRDLIELIERAGKTPDEIDHYLLHQANLRIVEAVRHRLHQPEAKFPHNIERTGNTSSASVPILLDELNRADKLKTGDLIAMSAFGAGLSTGAALLRWTL